MTAPEFHLDAARRLPPNIRFGTSSWNYPGWKDLIYRRSYRTKKAFSTHCLEEYAVFPWFRTVGIDSSFYAPPKRETLERYASQVPAGFQWVAKVWEAVTIWHYPPHRRYGARADTPNPDFLDPELFTEKFLPPFQQEACLPHNGPFVFQFATLPLSALPIEEFLDRLDAFLGALPADFLYAVELRNRELLIPRYFEVLNRRGATHVFNHWQRMPRLLDQMKAAADAGGLAAPFYVSRLLTPRGVSYAGAVKRFQPYDELKEPNETMREDIVRLCRRAIATANQAYILVNNRSEGNAPSTIDAIGARLVAELEAESEGEP